MSVFVDTSAFLALMDAAAVENRSAQRSWEGLLAGGESLICTNYVFVETFALAQRRFGMEKARQFCEDAPPMLTIAWVDEDIHGAAVAAVLAANRRQLSLVDCVSFEVMRRRGLRQVFCFDPHFREAGFETLP